MDVFAQIFNVFLVLGTLVGVVVIGYMVYNAYKYRADRGAGEGKVDQRPQLGELPQGGGGGRKLFLSFTLSAIIVLSLIAWTYGTLLYVEGKTTMDGQEADLVVEVTGMQFSWEYTYPDGRTTDTLHVPEDAVVKLKVTSADVFHNFGVPALRVKADAIPGETTETWFVAEEEGTYAAHCYEICGVAHSYMDSKVVVHSQAEYEEWASQDDASGTRSASASGNRSGASAIAAPAGV
ncbi:MAG: cytochrome c oxidase subunit II [Halobacteriaceae archaeon]